MGTFLDKEWPNHTQIIPDKTSNNPIPLLSNSILIGTPLSFTDTNHPSLLSALVLNCQSIIAKKECFMNLLDVYHPDIYHPDVYHPDIVFGCESWPKLCIVPSKVFPAGCTIYCNDHDDRSWWSVYCLSQYSYLQ